MSRQVLLALLLVIAACVPVASQPETGGAIVMGLTDQRQNQTRIAALSRYGAAAAGLAEVSRHAATAAGASEAQQGPAIDERRRVQTDVRALAEALYNGDIDTVVRLSHPNIIAMLGGPDATRAAIEAALLKLKSAGLRLESLTFPGPPEFLEGGGRRFAVVPTLSIVDANGQKLESLNFQLGILEPEASEWRYVEGSRLTKQNVQVLFPGFPANYEFPPFYRKKLP